MNETGHFNRFVMKVNGVLMMCVTFNPPEMAPISIKHSVDNV